MVEDVLSNVLCLPPLLMVSVSGASLDSSGYPPIYTIHVFLEVCMKLLKVPPVSKGKRDGMETGRGKGRRMVR